MDLFDKCRSDGGYFGPQRASGDEYFTRPVLGYHPGRTMEYQGRDHIMWSVNNYIGLAGNDEIKCSAVEAVQNYSVSSPMGSRMMSGTTEAHKAFEAELAEFSNKDAAILFNYGYLGVIGTIQALAGPDDTIVMDKLSHASIVDGAFLAQGKVMVYKHNNMDSLEIVLKRLNRDRKGGILIVGEGVYGMTGDLADLEGISSLAEKYGARTFIDDAHGWGVMGEKGRGSADYLGVQEKIDIYFGTFAKSFASIGGFAASDTEVIDWIRYNARSQVFAKSLPMVYVKSLQKTFELVKSGDSLRKKMWDNARALKDGLRGLGYFVGEGASPICSVFIPVGDSSVQEMGMKTVKFLRDEGIFVTAVIYPVIPIGLLMYRLIPTAAHISEDIEKTTAAYKKMRDELGLTLKMGEEEMKKLNGIYGREE